MSLGPLWSDGVLFGPHAGALVVDPSPLVREALAGRLRGLGARDVEEAASLEEARVRAHVSGPRALCVLEVDLPRSGRTPAAAAATTAAVWSCCPRCAPRAGRWPSSSRR
jgi:hypothetical protein